MSIWCVIYSMGAYDHILYDSVHYPSCESFRTIAQSIHDKPLSIMPKERVRQLQEQWVQVELCTGISVRNPISE